MRYGFSLPIAMLALGLRMTEFPITRKASVPHNMEVAGLQRQSRGVRYRPKADIAPVASILQSNGVVR